MILMKESVSAAMKMGKDISTVIIAMIAKRKDASLGDFKLC